MPLDLDLTVVSWACALAALLLVTLRVLDRVALRRARVRTRLAIERAMSDYSEQ
jgi:hypothetical protein